jgi:pimeloyl-ACP methyl ester carboxylesterase
MRAVAAIGCCAIACHAPATDRTATPSAGPAESGEVARREHTVTSDPGITVAFREVIAPGREAGVAVVLVHGAGVGGISAFDLPVPGYSLAEDLARAGHPAYAIDVRGWGRSTRPAVLDAPPEANPPAVSSGEAVRDIAAVVDWIRARRPGRIAVFGWATGGHWAGMYAANHPDAVSHLVMLNAIYGTPGAWSMRARLEDKDHPGQLAAIGAYSLRDTAGLLRPWDANIPVDDKASWRDPRVAEAYAATAIASDATSAQRTPPSARVPNGPLQDSYELASGTQLWRAGEVRAAALVIRSAMDFWSRPEDVAALQHELNHARRVEIAELAGATHLAHLDRPEHGRAQLIELLIRFLGER